MWVLTQAIDVSIPHIAVNLDSSAQMRVFSEKSMHTVSYSPFVSNETKFTVNMVMIGRYETYDEAKSVFMTLLAHLEAVDAQGPIVKRIAGA